jgi:hypothetical protein
MPRKTSSKRNRPTKKPRQKSARLITRIRELVKNFDAR